MTLRKLIGVLGVIYSLGVFAQVWNGSVSSSTPTYRSGNVGIGGFYGAGNLPQYLLGLGANSSLDTKLALFENASAKLGLGINTYNTSYYTMKFHLNSGSDKFGFYSSSNGTELLTLLGNGNVGIGIPNPNALLSLGSSSGVSKLAIYENGSTVLGLGYQTNQFRFHLSGTSDRFSFLSSASGTELLSLSGASGNLGVGITSAESRLHVTSPSNTSIKISNSNTASAASLLFNTTTTANMVNASINAVNQTGNAADLMFATGSTGSALERMRILNTGQIGVGTSTPGAFLHIKSDNGSNSALKLSGPDMVGIDFWPTTGDPTNGQRLARIESRHLGGLKSNLIFYTNNSVGGSSTAAEVMRIESNGMVGIGDFSATTMTEELNIRASNPGISLVATNTNSSSTINFNSMYSIGYADGAVCGSGWMNIGSSNTNSKQLFLGGYSRTNNNAIVFGTNPNIGAGCNGPNSGFPVLSGDYLFDGQASTKSFLVAAPATTAPTIPANYIFSSQGKSHFSDIVAIGYTPGSYGATLTDDYKLRVKGRVICEELKVQLSSAWPDYVFDNTYKLASLDSVETFIQENHHLPEVPSAQEVKENGVNTGEMNAILLRKIEELTLYMIDQQKQIEELKKKNLEIEAQLK